MCGRQVIVRDPGGGLEPISPQVLMRAVGARDGRGGHAQCGCVPVINAHAHIIPLVSIQGGRLIERASVLRFKAHRKVTHTATRPNKSFTYYLPPSPPNEQQTSSVCCRGRLDR